MAEFRWWYITIIFDRKIENEFYSGIGIDLEDFRRLQEILIILDLDGKKNCLIKNGSWDRKK